MARKALKREFYYPVNGKKLVLPKGLTKKDCEVWFYNSKDRFCAIGFKGKAIKPAFHIAFKDTEKRDDYTVKFYLGIAQELDRKKERSNFKNKLKVNDILYSMWGYEQTNVDFCNVEKVTEKMAEVCRLKNKVVSQDSFMSCSVVPSNIRTGERFRAKVLYPGDVIKLGYTNGRIWDGKPKNKTCYA